MTRLMLLPYFWVAGPLLLAGVLLALSGRRRSGLGAAVPLFAGCVLAAVLSIQAARVFWGPVPERFPTPVTVIIPTGSSTAAVARRLADAKVVADAPTLQAASRLTLSDRSIRSGRYHFPGGEGVLGVLQRLVDGATAQEMVTIPEGLRAPQVAGIVARQADVDSSAFMALVHDPGLIARVLPALPGEDLPESLEGYLLPETYNIYYRMPAEEVVRTMVALFDSLWARRLAGPAARLGMSRHQVVTLASIIEREAATDAERPIISAVFHNRLGRGMRLESCATVLYALGRYKPRLYEKDLQVDSPYNTYRVRGLPPGPIAAPGRASLLAAVQPERDDFLYFVARGDGTHTFSRTYAEHLRAKRGAGDGVLVGGRAAREAPPPDGSLPQGPR